MNLHLTNRKLRLETLEERALLAVTAGGFEQAVPLPVPTGETVWVVNTTDDPADWDAADDILSLREAIGRAEDGDTIVFDDSLAGGTVTLNWRQLEIYRGITIDAASIGGITIDADGASRVFYVNGENGSISVELISLTVTGGNAPNYDGGGIYNWYGTLTLTDSTVSGNSAGNNGGGIYNGYGTLTLKNSTVSGNTASIGGGGIYNEIGTLTVTNSTVSGNSADYGGGVYNGSGTLTVTNSAVSGNTASSQGGGIYNEYGTLTVANSTVSENSATYDGGGIINYGTLTLTNSAVSGNNANYGGGIYNYDSTLTLTNSTVSGNSATNYGGGIYNDSGTLTVTNTIVSLNDAEDQVSRDITGSYTKINSIVGNDPGFVTAPIFEAGKLVNADEIDLSLASYSNAIDVGTNDAVETDTDLAGNPRIFAAWKETPTVDIGAYEYQEQIDPYAPIVVTTLLDVVDESDGALSLREAIDRAAEGGTIVFDASLAGGTITLNRRQLEIYRGITIDAASVGGITVDAGGGSRVFYVNGENAENPVELISLTITGGKISSDGGGGIYNGYGTLTLTNSAVSGNTASNGGGIYNYRGTLSLTNSTVSGNSASNVGGGIYNYGTLTFTNSTVSGNSASNNGGGICNDSTLTLTNSTVSGNSASNNGGGIYNYGTLTLTNSTISGNIANYGGGIYKYSGTLTLTNTIVSLNDTEDQVYKDITGSYTKINSIVGDDPGFVTAPIFEAGKLVNADDIDLSLASYSNAIDTGNNAYVTTETDLAGNPRIFAAWKETPRVDIGAYEYQEQIDPPAPIVVTTLLDVVDESDGLISLREAIQLADIYGVVTFDASLANRAIILEGGELVISKELTIDARGIGGVTIDANDKSRVFHISQNAAVELAGLTINGGNDNEGAGIYNEGALTLTESEISWNIADNIGGGVYNRGTMSLVDSIVMGNTAQYGAGIYNNGTLTVTNSAVSENAASSNGGGIYTYSGTLTVANSTVSGNSASYGGGIYNEYGTLTVANSTVSENSASSGGGIYGRGTIINSTIVGNSASYSGGGIYGRGTIINSTIVGNTANNYGGGIYKDGTLSLANTIVSLNYANFDNDIWNYSDPITGGSNIVGLDPGFVAAPVFENGKLVNFDELDLSLTAGSYAIDHGTNDAVETETDLAGNPRIFASWKETATVDIGAYEYQARVQKGEIETPSTVVTTLLDIVDETDGLISLREAVLYAGAGDTVTFDAALAGRRIVLDGAELAIDKSITIDASAVGGITIDGGGRSRVFYVGSVTAGLTALTVQNGRAYRGGGIYNTGTLALTNVVITGCYAWYGGGIYNSSGRLTATNATVWGNSTLNWSSSYGWDLYNSGRAYFYNSIVAQRADYGIAVSGGLLYAYNTLSAFTNWNQSKNCPAYDSGKPLFTNPGKGDYTLAEKSQAIDVGNNTYVTTETDLAGNARIVNEIVDLGAYEFAVPAQKLDAPAILNNSRNTFISYGANRHNVVWSDIGHAAAYEFGYSANGGSTWTYVQTPYANYLLTGLTYGAEMTYRVRALSGAGYIDSEWSEARSFAVCPMDINGNGDISAADRAALAAAWLSEEGDANFLPAADINGDGEISGADRIVLSADWLMDATDPTLLYPRPLAADAALADYAPADLSIGLDVF